MSQSCEQPQHHVQYCPLTKYIELRHGEDFRVHAPVVFVEWFAERPSDTKYAYEVEALLGHCDQDGRYVLEDSEQVDAWLTLSDGIPRQYACDAYTTDEHRALLYSARFELEPVARSPELDRVLHVE